MSNQNECVIGEKQVEVIQPIDETGSVPQQRQPIEEYIESIVDVSLKPNERLVKVVEVAPTPAKIESLTRHKRPILDIVITNPTHAPHKLNVNPVVAIPNKIETQSASVSKQNVENQFEENIEKNDLSIDTLAIPVKVQLTKEYDSSITRRSTRRRQANIETEAIATKCTPKKLKTLYAKKTPNKLQMLSKKTQNESVIITENIVQENAGGALNMDQNEKVQAESLQNIYDIVASSTPAKTVLKSNENHKSAVPRSSRRKQSFAEIKSFTPKRPCRKLNFSLASATASKIEMQQEQPIDENIESIPNKGAKISTEQQNSNKQQAKVVEFNVASIPAKIKSINKKEQCNSAKKSKRSILDIATKTSTRTPRKLKLQICAQSEKETPKRPVDNSLSYSRVRIDSLGKIPKKKNVYRIEAMFG